MRAGWFSGALGTVTLLALTLGCSAGAPEPVATPEPAPAAAPRPPVAAAEAPVGIPEFDPSKWSPPEPKIKHGYLARYARMVSSGSEGAVVR